MKQLLIISIITLFGLSMLAQERSMQRLNEAEVSVAVEKTDQVSKEGTQNELQSFDKVVPSKTKVDRPIEQNVTSTREMTPIKNEEQDRTQFEETKETIQQNR